jgi:hypothetical protein
MPGELITKSSYTRHACHDDQDDTCHHLPHLNNFPAAQSNWTKYINLQQNHFLNNLSTMGSQSVVEIALAHHPTRTYCISYLFIYTL